MSLVRPVVATTLAGGMLATALAACDSPTDVSTGGVICAAIFLPAMVAEVRDDAGRPVAPGAHLSARFMAFPPLYADTATGGGDPLRISSNGGRPGCYVVTVAKAGYETTTVPDVVVPGGPCGVTRPTVVPVTLRLRADAPAVRTVTVTPSGAGFGAAGLGVQYRAIVDAADGVSTAVTWTVSDTMVATITADGRLTARCRTASGDALVVATSVADPTKRGTGRVGVFANATSCPVP